LVISSSSPSFKQHQYRNENKATLMPLKAHIPPTQKKKVGEVESGELRKVKVKF